MKFKARKLDISTGESIVCLLNSHEAMELELSNNDRVEITYRSKKIIASIDITNTHHFLRAGEIGLMGDVADKLGIKNTSSYVSVELVNKPLSLYYIKKKLQGKRLTDTELFEIVQDIVSGKLSNIDITYFVSACYANELNMSETVALTNAMLHTGDILKLSRYPIVDKHCIGGVAGNRTTMIVVPILTALGFTMPKTSSRSITSPAGTADAMEVLCPVTLSIEQMKTVIEKTNGCIVWGGALNLAPADDKIIKVEHPLSLDPVGQLLASIMAKKKSVSSTHLLIDIPYGKGAKIEDVARAHFLKKKFLQLSKKLHIKTIVELTDGSSPIGFGLGPALEARDVLLVLENDPTASLDLKEKSIQIAGSLLSFLGKKHGEKMARDVLESGHALHKFMEIIEAQGGKKISSSDISLAKEQVTIKANQSGFISHLDNKKLSKIAKLCGAPNDKGAGLYLHVKKHDKVQRSDVLMTLYSSSKQKLHFAKETFGKIGGITII